MNITFSLELNTSNTSSREGRVLIRCTQNRRHKRVSTGVSVPVISWDKTLQKVKKNHPLAVELNNLLIEKLKKVTAVYTRLSQEKDEVFLDEVFEAMNTNVQVNFFDFAYRTKMATFKSNKKLGTYRRYDAILNKFKEFAGKNLSMNQVTYSLLRQYEIYLVDSLGNTRNTVASNLSGLRSIINEAIREEVYTKRNPFEQLKLSYTDSSKEKLTVEELHRLMNSPLPNIYSIHLAKDFFLACFLAEGTRAGDMIAMKKEHVVNNCLIFQQQKTGSKMVIPIATELMQIFDKYMSAGSFIFPMLNNEPVVNEIIIGNKLAYINKYLKELSKYCGIFKRLSSHVARHTFTDLALQVTDDNIYQVQQSLGHSSVKTTEIYSRNRVNYKRVSIMPEILRHLE